MGECEAVNANVLNGQSLEKHCVCVCVCVCVRVRVPPLQVQLSLYTYLSAEFIGTATIYTTIRRVGTVLQLMHTLKYYYWACSPLECSGITPKGLGTHARTHTGTHARTHTYIETDTHTHTHTHT